MKKYILGAILSLCLLVSPAFVPQAEAAGLSATQISAIIGLLQAFGADQSVIANVQATLSGGSTTPSGTSPTALITINGQPSVTNADPLVPRTWGWSGTPGATYSASGNITGCENTSQNGPQPDWKPWIGSTGTAANGSTSATPGAVKYGCVIVGTYNVTKDGKTTTSTATITYKHANTATTPPSQTSVEQVEVAVGEYVLPGAIPDNQYNLGFWAGGDNVTCSLVSGNMPSGLKIVSLRDVSKWYSGCALAGTAPSALGTFKITWKGSDTVTTVTKDLEIIIYKPEKSLHIITNSFPDAVVGQQYSAPITVETEGDWYGLNMYIDFESNMGDNLTGSYFDGGLGGLSMELIPNQAYVARDGSSLSGFDINSHETRKRYSSYLTGVPKASGTFTVGYKAGNGTAAHMTWSRGNIPFVIKPRVQSQSELDADIMGKVNSLTWTASTNQASGSSLKKEMDKKGWTFHDIVVATKYRTMDLVKLLYPDVQERKFMLDNEITLALKMSTNEAVAYLKKEGIDTGSVIFWGPYVLTGPSSPKILSALAAMPPTPPQLRITKEGGSYHERNVSGLSSEKFTLDWFDSMNNPTEYRMIITGKYDSGDRLTQEGRKTFGPKSLSDFGLTEPGEYVFTIRACNANGCSGDSNQVTYVATSASAVNSSPTLTLTTLSPSSGTVGTTVTINGSGFTGTNNIYMNNVLIDATTQGSSGGSTPTWISFVIPSNLPSCPGWDRFCTPGPVLTSGTHLVRVQNTNGTSNAVSFVVN